MLAVPLTGRGRTLAAVGLVSTDPGRVFTSEDLALAEEVADRAGLALDNARLYEQAARRARGEAVLRRATAAVTAKLELADVARAIASNALVVIDAAGAFVERVDRGEGRVTVVAAAGDLVPAVGTSAAYEGSLAQQVIRVGEAERIRDVGAPGERVPKVLATTYDRGPALVVPMLRQETVGALFFLRPSGAPPFSDDDVERAGIFGELAGLALRKAHLLEIAEQRRIEAEAATRGRDDMLAIVAHDLRNPVHTVAMAASLLDDPTIRLSEAQRHQHQQIIARSARRMNRLIRDLLDVGQIEAGRLTVKCEVTDAARIVADVCDAYQPIAEERRQRVRCESERQIPRIDADRDRIVQVLGNYLDNALKFSPAGTEIVLRVAADPDRSGVRFSVCDVGPGIAPEALPHVFERYWQERSTAHKGAGLGLAIAKGIAEAHGGRVWAESVLGKGSTFYLWLPTSPECAEGPVQFN
jgi:signal transduction histidine kinase